MSIIYIITSNKGNKSYVGSTILPLHIRKRQHKSKNHTCSSRILMEEYGFENCDFTVLEECPIEQRYERERFYINNYPNNVNTVKRPVRTQEDTKEYNTDYYKHHQNRIKTTSKKNGSIRVECDICGRESRKDHLPRHKRLKHSGAIISE